MPVFQRFMTSILPGPALRALGAALLLALGFPALAATPVTLQLKWTHNFQFAGYYAALEKGYYRDAGLEVRIEEARPGLDVVGQVVSGRADFGVGNSALLLAIQALWTPRVQPVYRCLEDHFHSESVWQRAIIEHREILEAIKQGDAKAARAAMHRHMKNVRTRFSSNWRED